MSSFADLRGFLQSSWGQYLLSWMVAGALMWAGAHLAGLRYAGFWRAMATAVVVTFLTWTLAAYLSDSLGIFGFAVSISVTLFIIKSMFETSWERAFLVWAFNAVAQFAVITV